MKKNHITEHLLCTAYGISYLVGLTDKWRNGESRGGMESPLLDYLLHTWNHLI